MSDELRLACAQPTNLFDIAGNVESHAALVRSSGSDVVLFPELSLTGYDLEAEVIAVDDPRLTPLVEACATSNTTALVGAPVAGSLGTQHIATIALDADGPRVVYHKMNVGTDESTRFADGRTPAVIEVRGWRLGLAICRDTGIETHAAATAARGIDAYLASVVDHPEDAGVQLGRARRVARDHGVWVGVASGAGRARSGFDATAGRSFVLSPTGEVVDRVGAAAGETARATLQRG